MRKSYDAVIVGSGPNGLAAGIRLAQAGRSVLVIEAKPVLGGGATSSELTLPGFVHDVCSAVHPLAAASHFFRALPLGEHGLEWVQPAIALAHPLENGRVACLFRSVEQTLGSLGRDGPRYRRWLSPWVPAWPELFDDILAPPHFPKHPVLLARFGRWAIQSARRVIDQLFEDDPARCLFAGLAAHSFLPLTRSPSAAIGLVLAIAGHAVGWPIPRGGSQKISDALAAHFLALGGEAVIDSPVRSLSDIPEAKMVLFDLVPREILRIVGDHLPEGYRRRLGKFRYGPGSFKLDWALSGPIPWIARECREAGTVHLGGSLGELMESEAAPWKGAHVERPFVLLSQPSLFDPSRAPEAKHTAWAYCHVPRGSDFDMTERIESQIERFAPGFKDLILARSVMPPSGLERHNPNLVGGDVSGGVADLRQIFLRPVPRLVPYSMPVRNWFICSASTPPGTGVHGMCGFHAANAVLKRLRCRT